MYQSVSKCTRVYIKCIKVYQSVRKVYQKCIKVYKSVHKSVQFHCVSQFHCDITIPLYTFVHFCTLFVHFCTLFVHFCTLLYTFCTLLYTFCTLLYTLVHFCTLLYTFCTLDEIQSIYTVSKYESFIIHWDMYQ